MAADTTQSDKTELKLVPIVPPPVSDGAGAPAQGEMPFAVVDGSMALHILGRALGNLRGWVSFRRFPNDPYYLRGGEIAEWGMTSPHMLLCVNQIGLYPVEEDLKDWKPIKLLEEKNYPESFVGLEKEPNANTPLAWTKAMCLLAQLELRQDDNSVD